MLNCFRDVACWGALGATLAVTALTGCGVGPLSTPTPSAQFQGFQVQGHVHGGAFPIQNATIRVMETQTQTTPGTSIAAKQLATTLSDATGAFTFNTINTCDSGQYAYITVTGGHTGANTVNNDVVQVGVIGSCDADLSTTAEIANVNVFVSELSTVAAAYTLKNFISINTNGILGVSTGQQLVNISAPANNMSAKPGCTNTNGNMACTANGLGHAFASAANMVDSVRYDGTMPTGTANQTFVLNPNAQAVVPRAMINTLGNILQNCVDSSGSQCNSLFTAATPPNGTAPTNTLQAAINIAANPNNNVKTLFALQPNHEFFTPDLSSYTYAGTTTNISFTLSIFYTGTGMPGDQGLTYPIDVALDSKDNAYVVYTSAAKNSTYSAIDGFTANGYGIFAGPRFPGNYNPNGIALDNVLPTPNYWITDDNAPSPYGGGGLYGFSTADGSLTHQLGVPGGFPAGVAVETNNSVWISRDDSNASDQSFYRFDSTNSYNQTVLSGAPKLGFAATRFQLDAKQNLVGVTSSTTANAYLWHYDYASVGGGSAPFSAQLNTTGGFAIAVTNADENYMPLNGQLDTGNGFTTGTLDVNDKSDGYNTSASTTGASYTTPLGAAVDGAGTVYWTDFEAAGQVFWLVPSNNSVARVTPMSFLPCFETAGQCSNGASWLRGMSIDSAGVMWYVADNPNYAVVQTFGLAAPTWPLLQYTHAGVAVQ